MTQEVTMTLREAIRALQNAERLVAQAQVEEHDLTVIENRKEDVKIYGSLVELLREQTTTCVVCEISGESDLDLPIDAINLLIQQGILYECLICEERDDLDEVYGGDHREFHYREAHNDCCALKALHVSDPTRWKAVIGPKPDYDRCAECTNKQYSLGEERKVR